MPPSAWSRFRRPMVRAPSIPSASPSGGISTDRVRQPSVPLNRWRLACRLNPDKPGTRLEIAAICVENSRRMVAGIIRALSLVGRLGAGVALAAVLGVASLHAQSNSLFSAGAGSSLLAPDSAAAARQNPLLLPPSPPPAQQQMLMVPAGKVALELGARFGKDAPPITSGLTWRIYNAKPDTAGSYHLVREDKGPAPTMVLPPGPYIVHVGFGLANAVKPVTLRSETVRETFELPA